MDWTTIITSIITFVAGGGIFTLVTIGVQKKKLKVEVKSDEIENMKKAMESFYDPLIQRQNTRISELETEVKTLREEKHQLEISYQRQIADLQKQITEITRALGIKANKQLRNGRGQFTAEKEAK
jgi:small-conductance mechanosensitive channel